MRRMCCENNRGRVRLLVAVACLAVGWLVVLPKLGAIPALRRKIDYLDARGINPSATYYTDLEAMSGIYCRTTKTVEENRSAFYWPSRRGSRRSP